MQPTKRQGFTLIELAIVMVIIGLIVGGILGGQSVLRTNQLRLTSQDLSNFSAAYGIFVDRYDDAPGNVIDATKYWGTDPNGCPTNGVYTPRKETCDGNGINFVFETAERFRAWQHLANAQLVDGMFSGVAGSGGANQTVPGQNSPKGRVDGSAYAFISTGPLSGNANYFDLTYAVSGISASDMQLLLGMAGTAEPTGPIFTPTEQWNLDTKLDDGKAGTGILRSYKAPLNPSCVTGSNYDLSQSGKNCSVIYLLDAPI